MGGYGSGRSEYALTPTVERSLHLAVTDLTDALTPGVRGELRWGDSDADDESGTTVEFSTLPTSGVDRWKRGKRVSQPHFDSWSVVYDKRSATFYRNHASLSTVAGRIDCEFVLHRAAPRRTSGTCFPRSSSSAW